MHSSQVSFPEILGELGSCSPFPVHTAKCPTVALALLEQNQPKKLLSSGQSQAADCGPAATAVTIGGTSSRDGKHRIRAPEPRSGQMCARQPNGGFVRLLVPICSAWPFFPLPALGTHPNLRVVNLHNLPSEALGVFVDIFSFGITLQCIRLFTSYLVSSLGSSLTC